MSNNILPDLSKWHEVPLGATIPVGTRYVFCNTKSTPPTFTSYADSGAVVEFISEQYTYFTEQKIEAPFVDPLESVLRDVAPATFANAAKAVRDFLETETPAKPKPKQYTDRDGDTWTQDADTYTLTKWLEGTDAEVLEGGNLEHRTFESLSYSFGPLTEVK